LSNNEQSIAEQTRFGVIGTGRITRRVVAELQSTPGVQVTAIASRTADRAQWYADQYGIGNAVQGYAALLDRDDVDAVYIALPPSLHAEWTIAAAEAGKHVLCEKPLAQSLPQAEQMAAACRSHAVRWLDATGWLHHPRTTAMRQWLDAKLLGKVGHISVSVSFYQPFQSNDHRLDMSLGGGCLLDLGWYAAGLLRFVTGQKPTRVFADAMIVEGVPQRVTAMLWFEDHITASLSCGFDTATRKWFEVAGTDASLVCDDFTRPWAEKPARCWIHERSGQVKTESFDGQQEQAMITCLASEEPLEDFHAQALDTQHMLDVMIESIETQQSVTIQ